MPEHFEVPFKQSPLEALRRALEVLSVYWELVSTRETPVDWQCESEYTVAFVLSTKATDHFTTGGTLVSFTVHLACAMTRHPPLPCSPLANV